MKKNAAFLLLLMLLMGACVTKTAKENPVKKKTLFILVYDISKSNESYAILNKGHFESVYTNMGHNGGGKMYSLHIQSNSDRQEPANFLINALDTAVERGNRVQASNIRKKNRTLIEGFISGREAFVSKASEIMLKEKTEKFSDVQNALLLAKQIVNMPEYASWEKCIIIVSDMLNDLPPRDGIDPLKPVDFEVNVKIGVVRPSNRVNLGEVFPKLTVTNYATIEDGIHSLITLN